MILPVKIDSPVKPDSPVKVSQLSDVTPLKVLMLTSSYPKFAGDVTAPFIEAIAQFSQKRGHQITVLMAYHPDLKRPPHENGVKLETYKYVPFKSWNIWGYAASLEADVKVRKLIYLLLPLVLVSSFIKLWKLTARDRFAIIQVHWVIPNAPVAVLIGWLRQIPVVISLHGSDIYVAERHKLVGWVARWAFSRAAAVTASSPDLLARAQKLGATTNSQRAVVIPYGADPLAFQQPAAPRSQIRAQLGFAPDSADEPVLLCVGRLVYKKGFEYAIRAMPAILQKFPQARLVIAGKGDLRAELQTLAAELGVSGQIRFEGAVPHNLLPNYLAACDLFLLPSVIDKSGNVDGLPNTLLEAMAAAKAVVASAVAGVPLAVTEGENGCLVPAGDSTKLAEAVIRLLAKPQLREKLGQAARLRVEQDLNWNAIAARFEKVFELAANS